MINTLAVGV